MDQSKKVTIHNKELLDAIASAEKSEGYLVVITKRNNGKLQHIYFTQRFLRDDIPRSLKKHEELLERELEQKSTESKEEPKVETQKELPPEYREKVEDENK